MCPMTKYAFRMGAQTHIHWSPFFPSQSMPVPSVATAFWDSPPCWQEKQDINILIWPRRKANEIHCTEKQVKAPSWIVSNNSYFSANSSGHYTNIIFLLPLKFAKSLTE